MWCCDELEKLLEMGFVFKGDKYFLMYARKGTDKRVLEVRFCPFCGEGPLKKDELDFWEMLDEGTADLGYTRHRVFP